MCRDGATQRSLNGDEKAKKVPREFPMRLKISRGFELLDPTR